MRRVSTLCPPLTPLHPWQHDPPLPSKIVIDLSNHTPYKLVSPEGWEILRRNGRVWIVEHNRREAQLDVAQYGMLLVHYNNSDEHSIPSAKFLSSLGTSCIAQRMADLEYNVHWSRHLLVCIHHATGAEALKGASAVTYNRTFSPHLSVIKVLVRCRDGQMYQSLVLDSFPPLRRKLLLKRLRKLYITPGGIRQPFRVISSHLLGHAQSSTAVSSHSRRNGA
jgi:hypothetical protein